MALLDRGLNGAIQRLLASVPVVVVEGPRASGKTTLGEQLAVEGAIASRVDLADSTVRRAAVTAPNDFIDSLALPAFIDEAQLVPELSLAVKQRVDHLRQPGQFVLTGSSRLGRAQLGGSDPLAGRAARVRLWPMTQGELSGSPTNLVDRLLAASPTSDLDTGSVSRDVLGERIARGGLPTAAGVDFPVDAALRSRLMREYLEGVIEHEVGRRHDRVEVMRQFRYLAGTTARLLNVSSVANELASRRETIQSRLASLESIFLVHLLPGHRPAEHRTLTAHPKVHAVDVGLAAWATRAGQTPDAATWGALVETFVVNELAAQASWSTHQVDLRHWRDTSRRLEVDALLISDDGPTVAVEVKAARDVRSEDMKGLQAFLAGGSSTTDYGVVFYSGERVLRLDEQIWAIPISALWMER